jgi:hypothetical protein
MHKPPLQNLIDPDDPHDVSPSEDLTGLPDTSSLPFACSPRARQASIVLGLLNTLDTSNITAKRWQLFAFPTKAKFRPTQ